MNVPKNSKNCSAACLYADRNVCTHKWFTVQIYHFYLLDKTVLPSAANSSLGKIHIWFKWYLGNTKVYWVFSLIITPDHEILTPAWVLLKQQKNPYTKKNRYSHPCFQTAVVMTFDLHGGCLYTANCEISQNSIRLRGHTSTSTCPREAAPGFTFGWSGNYLHELIVVHHQMSSSSTFLFLLTL